MVGAPDVSRQVYSVQLARWKWTDAYCTDRVGLEIVIVGYPPETPARIRIIHVTDSNAETEIETIDATLTGGRIDAEWIAKGAVRSHAQWENHLPCHLVNYGFPDRVLKCCQSPTYFRFAEDPLCFR